MTELTELIGAARRGEQGALDRLVVRLYPELHRIAHRRLSGHPPATSLQTTALVHESYLRLVQAGRLDVADRAHFLAYAARVMRSIIVDYARRRAAERRGGDLVRITLNADVEESVALPEDEIVRVNDALEHLAQAEPRLVQVVEMRYFAGYTELEIAEALGIGERTVRRDWERARLLLKVAVE